MEDCGWGYLKCVALHLKQGFLQYFLADNLAVIASCDTLISPCARCSLPKKTRKTIYFARRIEWPMVLAAVTLQMWIYRCSSRKFLPSKIWYSHPLMQIYGFRFFCPRCSFVWYLKVKVRYSTIFLSVSKARIVGERDVMVHEGSDINLTCKAEDSPEPPQSVVWYR